MRARLLVCGVVVAGVWLGPQTWAAAPADDASRRALRRTPVVEVFERTRDAVVNIAATRLVRVRRSPFPFDTLFDEIFQSPFFPARPLKQTSLGSGFVIHQDGFIVTNAHVVSRSAELKVIFASGAEYEARIIALDREHDLAVVKIDPDEPLPTIPFGRSDDLMVGETVIAIGNPLGYQHTVTTGVVSAVNRTLEFRGGVRYTNLIQTDASINPGNSGGPLLNVLGELIGINTAIRGDAQNIGFAIPVDTLRALLPEMLDPERLKTAVVGLKVGGAEAAPRIVEVAPASPAARAGLRPGDVITAIDGQAVQRDLDVYIALLEHRPGETLDVEYQRNGHAGRARLELEPQPEPDAQQLAMRRLGIRVTEITPALAEQIGLRPGSGLIVTEVEPGGPADRVDMQPADVLTQLGRYRVRTLDDLAKILSIYDPGDVAPIGVYRITRGGIDELTGRIELR